MAATLYSIIDEHTYIHIYAVCLGKPVVKFIVPYWGIKLMYGIGFSYQPARRAYVA
jgi:hypothetical protein